MTETPTPRTQQHWAEAVAECVTDEQEALRLIGMYEDDEWQSAMLDIGRALLAAQRALTAEREARERAEKERDAIVDQYRAFAALDRGDVWYWQGDGSDHPESLASGCRVVMTGAQVRELTAVRAERDALLRFKRFVHGYLTQREVPEDPPGKHRDEGCRVGQRLQYVCDERDEALAEAERLREALRDVMMDCDHMLLADPAASRDWRNGVRKCQDKARAAIDAAREEGA